MGISLPGGLAETLSMMGVQFPTTDEDALTAAATEWEQLASKCNGWHADLSQAVSHVQTNNEGEAASAFAAYMAGRSNVTGIQALGQGCTAIATGHRNVANAVKALKSAYIATASAIKVVMDAAKQQPNADVAALMAQVQQAGEKLRQLDQQTANSIQGA